MSAIGSDELRDPSVDQLLNLGRRALAEALPTPIINSLPSSICVKVSTSGHKPVRVEIVIADETSSELGISVWEVGVFEEWGSMIPRVRNEFASWFSETSFGWGQIPKLD